MLECDRLPQWLHTAEKGYQTVASISNRPWEQEDNFEQGADIKLKMIKIKLIKIK